MKIGSFGCRTLLLSFQNSSDGYNSTLFQVHWRCGVRAAYYIWGIRPLKESKLRVDMFAADHVKNRLVRPVGPYSLPVWILIPLDYDRQIMKYVQEPE